MLDIVRWAAAIAINDFNQAARMRGISFESTLQGVMGLQLP